MTLEAILGSEKKMIVMVSLIMIAAGVLADFIVDIVWWSRLHPWFAHAEKTGKTTYGSLTAGWVFCLVAIIVLALIAIFKFFVQSLYEKIGENRLISIVVIGVVSVLSLVIVICSIIPSGYALKKKEIEGSNYKCLMYTEEGVYGVCKYFGKKYHIDPDEVYSLLDAYAFDYGDFDFDLLPKDALKFAKWYKKYTRHYYNEKKDKITDYYCAEVGAPALVFSLILLIGVVIFLVVAFPVLKGSSDGDNKSENENPQ